MGWDIPERGFGVVFDPPILAFVDGHLTAALAAGLHKMRLEPGGFDRLICHPGATKVLEAIASTLALGPGRLDHGRTVLWDFGNMSAPTVLFVLERVLRDDAPRRARARVQRLDAADLQGHAWPWLAGRRCWPS